MNNTTAYTPLESLLLFQSLFAWGTESITFSRVSEALKNHELINQAPTYDPGRLSSDALRELYKRWLREEGEGEDREDSGSPPPSKKRKLQSPTLALTEDRNEHKEKLARLVDRSYALYTKSIVRDIREDERNYDRLEREIQELESRESEKPVRDEHVNDTRQGSTPVETGVGPKSSSSGEFAQPERLGEAMSRQGSIQTKEIRRQPLDPSPPAPSPSSRSDGFAISDLVNGPSPPRTIPHESIAHSRNGSHSSQNAYPFSARPSPLQTVGMTGPQVHNNWNPQPSPMPFQSYQHNPNSPQFAAPFSPSQHHHRGSFSAPGMPPHHTPIPSSPLTTSGHNSVIQLPPLVSHPSRSSASPARSLDALADLAGQQNHIPASPHLQQGIQTHNIYGGQQFNNYNLDGRPQSGNGHQPYPPVAPVNNQPHLPPLGFPPPQPPAGYGHPRSTENSLVGGQQPNAQYTSPYNGLQNGPLPVSSIPNHISRVAALSTPMRPSLETRQSLSNLPRTPAFSNPIRPANSTGKMGTRWKPLDTLPQELTPRFPGGPRSPRRPTPEPLSPVLVPAKLAPTATPKAAKEPSQSAARPTKKSADNPKGSDRTKRGVQRNRAGSNTSSIVDSNRSQSEMSHADELSLDNGMPSRRVKQEVATPRIPVDEDVEEITPDESSSMANDRRRGKPRDEAEPPSRLSMKRKRAESPIPSPRKPAGPATHVIWTRNFSKICASALDSVSGHRNASTFSAPVKDRDAPQYSSLIKYPQDLKSIRTAINAGTRAAVAAANAAGFDQSQMTVKLPISDELVPPHGIVNTQQLEKELAHMFANAVMYNPSPTGFVPWFKKAVADKKREDYEQQSRAGKKPEPSGQENYEVEEFAVFNETRIMSKDVDKIFGELKAAERPMYGDFDIGSSAGAGAGAGAGKADAESVRAVEDDEEDELAGDGDGIGNGMGSLAKRRRRA